MKWVDLAAEMSWLRPPLYWASESETARLQADLDRLGFATFSTSGRPVSSEAEFLADLRGALNLDEPIVTWNAFVDLFGDVVRSEERPIAIVWREPAATIKTDPAVALAIHSTLSSIAAEWNRMGATCHQVVLFLSGGRSVQD